MHLGQPHRLFAALAMVLVLLPFGTILFHPKTAHAQTATVVTSDLQAQVDSAVEVLRSLKRQFQAGLVASYVVNLMSFAANRLAYDAAVFISSGGNGDQALFNNQQPGEYFADFGAAVAGEAVGLLQNSFEGFNLCDPGLEIRIVLSLGIAAAFERPEPKCDFQEIVNNWEGFIAQVQGEDGGVFKNGLILTELANVYDEEKNEFAVGLQVQSNIFSQALEKANAATLKHIQVNGFQDVADFITGNVETPAEFVSLEYVDGKRQAKSVPFEAGRALIANTDALLQVGIQAGSVFTNTLLSELTQKLYAGLFNLDAEWPDPFADIESLGTSNAANARDQFRSLLTFTPLEITNYSILNDFGSCPVSRGLYNCVADQSLITAIARSESGVPLTIEEAVEEGLLHGDWPLLPSADLARNQDPFCYTYGYCAGNLVKLRKARAISVGWELAAESPYNNFNSPVTLQEVLDGFHVCNSEGLADANHPWCKMIDPNWVLKYPETQCKAFVNGQLLEIAASDERQTECVDMPSCISEGDDGSCTGGYGYCVAEENVWRFRGESCPSQYASCLTFDGEEGEESFLQTTLDYGPCNESNAGCLWYATQKEDPEGDGTYDWQPVDDIALADADPDAYNERIYFTAAVEECDADDGGCRELVERDDDLRLNIVANPGFEAETNNDGSPDSWIFTSPAIVDPSGTVARSGRNVVNPGTGTVTQPGIAYSQGRFYTLSFYARQKASGGLDLARLRLGFASSDAATDIDFTGTSIVGDCVIKNAGLGGDNLNDGLELAFTPTDTNYERVSCTFTSPIVTNPAALITAYVELFGDVYFDDVQIEQGEDASSYHEAYSATDLSTIVAKVPPSYLGCDGGSDDPADCANYAQVCSENDVGCSAYTPTNGDPLVTGIVSELDVCPAECSGYDTYKQEPTLYEPEGVFPMYFIPDTAQTCSEEDVGCDEFTNLSNEALEYYTYLRACVTKAQAVANVSSDNEAVFYTWEGSDLEGYQLKTWDLIESNLGSSPYTHNGSGIVDSAPGLAPCSNWTATDIGIICSDAIDVNGDTVYDWDTTTCDEHADIFTNSDCREFYDANGGIHYREWSKSVTVSDACTAYRKTELAGVDLAAQQANCTNSGGFYEAVSGTCRYNGLAEESEGCSANVNGCRSFTGGRSRNSRIVIEDFFEEGTVTNWDTSSAANATLSNESLATGGHSIAATDEFSNFFFDNGSVCATAGGCPGTAASLGGTCTVSEGDRYCGELQDELFTGKTYTISFIAKGSGTLDVGFDLAAVQGALAATDVPFGSVALTSDWQTFTLGPVDITSEAYPSFEDGTQLVFDPSSLAYVDNIVLREGEDNITLIKNSWVTPATCDQSPTGASSPQYHLGCQEYTTQDNETVYAKSFSRLCDSDEVGCEDFFLTQESASPYAEIFNATCSNPAGAPVTSATSCYYQNDGAGGFDTSSEYLCTIAVGFSSCNFSLNWYVAPGDLPTHLNYGPEAEIVSADSDVFLVINDDVTCSSGSAGCQEVGNIDWNQDRNSTKGATSVFLLNDPDTYADTLCSADALFCAAWGTDNDGTFFFKDPIDQTCEYRTDVTVNGAAYDGWFRTGNDDFCYGTCTDGLTACSSDAECSGGDTCNTKDPSYLVGGDFSGVWRNGDAAYGGWTATCPSENSTCSEFQDPLDVPSNDLYGEGDGAQYFYLNNENLDENSLPDSQKCNDEVSQKEGCILFNDTTEPAQGFNASATDIASLHADALFGQAPFSLVDPIDCETGDSTIITTTGEAVDLCANRCGYDLGLINDITDGVDFAAKIVNDETGAGADTSIWNIDNLYTFGGSCYVDSDCPAVRSQAGEDIAGNCKADVRVNPKSDPDPNDPVPRLENDTNTILKVNRDRQCSEWLSCADAQTVWDERTNTYRTICGDIELCSEYSSLGNSSFCSKWEFDRPEVVFTADEYVERDVSWYGDEYSGYSIPEIFPVQTLAQANVSPPAGSCNLFDALERGEVSEADYDTYHGEPCTLEEDCGGDGGSDGTDYCVDDEVQDYRLVLDAGTCSEDFGESCTAGYCKKTGAACSSTTDCGTDGGNCITGSCYDVDVTALCTSDDECAEGQVCLGSTCATQTSYNTVEEYNANPANPCGGDTFAASVNLKTGSCIRNECLLTPQGDSFDPGESEGKLCRAYPEVNSPFSNEIVDRWLDSETNESVSEDSVSFDWEDEAYDLRSNFENAQICAPGQVCDCSYKKITFGEGGDIKYFSPDFKEKDERGICSSGEVGKRCSQDSECDSSATSQDGLCSLPSKEDLLLGLDGYCLEKDSSINILGDRAKNACLTWLPVDQLAGSTDLYAKYITAGVSEDLYYCGKAKTFANVRAEDWQGCAAIKGEDGLGSGTGTGVTLKESDDCRFTVTCPDGFWAVSGRARYGTGAEKGEGTIAEECNNSVTNFNNHSCPYICVPKHSVHDDGSICTVPDSNVSYEGASVSGTYFYHVNDYGAFGDYYDSTYTDCTYYGASLEDDELGVVGFNAHGDINDALGGDISPDYQFVNNNNASNIYDTSKLITPYPACLSLVQTASSDVDVYNAAWTDRILGPKSTTVISVGDNGSYDKNTTVTPFGQARSPDDIENGLNAAGINDPTPAAIPSCYESLTKSFYRPSNLDDVTACDGNGLGFGSNNENPEARDYLDWFAGDSTSAELGAADPVSTIADRLMQLFAIPLDVWRWDPEEEFLVGAGEPLGSYQIQEDPDVNFTIEEWDLRATEGIPPTVWALDTAHCTGTECEEGRLDAITVNEQDSGEQSAFEFFRAYLKFYAAAYKEQLPIRRVIVDWGDGEQSGSDSPDNFYKNHRGLQEGRTTSKCATNDEWGMTEVSCDPNYFSYSHVYTCSSTLLLEGPACGADANGDGAPDNTPCVNNFRSTDATCSFQPKIHVRDNWGWCTGICTAGSVDGTDGCYDGDLELANANEEFDECDYTHYPEGNSEVDPWIYYDGVITVDPDPQTVISP